MGGGRAKPGPRRKLALVGARQQHTKLCVGIGKTIPKVPWRKGPNRRGRGEQSTLAQNVPSASVSLRPRWRRAFRSQQPQTVMAEGCESAPQPQPNPKILQSCWPALLPMGHTEHGGDGCGGLQWWWWWVGGDGDMEPYQQDSRSLLCSTPKMLLLNPQPLSKAFALTDPEPD